MSHPRPSLLHRYVLGEADGDERLIVERHAAACAACRTALSAERRLDELLVEAGAPADPTLDRAALQALWARVDAEPAPLLRPRWPRAAAAAALLLGAAAALWLARPGHDASMHPAATSVAPAPMKLPAPPPAPAPPAPQPAPPPLDPADLARLAAVRGELCDVLRAAQRAAPGPRAELLAACEPALSARRADGWPVDRLVASFVADADPDVARAALRLAAGTREGQPDVAACLRDPARTLDALDALQAADARPPAGATLASALAALVQPAPDGGLGALDVHAARLLAQDSGDEARDALGRLLDRALAAFAAASGADPERFEATHARLLALAAAAPADLVAERACAALGRGEGPGDVLDSALARDPMAADAGLRAALEGASADTCRQLASLAAHRQLNGASGALLAALARHPELPELRDAVAALAGPADAPALVTLIGSQRGHQRAELEELLLAAMRRDPKLLAAAGCALAADVDSALRLALALGATGPSPGGPALLLAALSARAPGRAAVEGTSALLSALAATRAADAGEPLLAWIAARPADDPCLPLAWTTAARLAPAPALTSWTREVGDPRPLARAADGGGAWPAAAPAPPRRLLEPVRTALLDASRDRESRIPAGHAGPPESR